MEGFLRGRLSDGKVLEAIYPLEHL
jgi:hypothetical protein